MNTNAVDRDALANAALPTRLLLSVKQVAQALGIGERTVWRLSATGELPDAIRIGRLRRWRRSTLEAWLARAEREARHNANRA